MIEYLIVGLGNPGSRYENTRHNVGFKAIDTLAKKYNISVKKIKYKSLIGDGMINNKHCLLIKPDTFMNNSGQAVMEAVNFYNIPFEKVIVIYDDISLDPAKLRIRRKGSAGGHNGIKSIIYLSGNDEFPRIKIGIGKKPHPEYNLADFVLSTFSKEDNDLLKDAYSHIPNIIENIVDDKIDVAMNKYNK